MFTGGNYLICNMVPVYVNKQHNNDYMHLIYEHK